MRHRPGTGDRRQFVPAIVIAALVVALLALWVWVAWGQAVAFFSAQPLGGPWLAVSCFMAGLPLTICVIQSVTRRRLLDRLHAVAHTDLANTCSFHAARRGFESIAPAALTGDYALPLLLNFAINFMLLMAIFVGFRSIPFLSHLNFFLLGFPGADLSDKAVYAYQIGTFAVMAAAFLGNYVYTLSQLLNRVNTNDLVPLSLHFYTARVFIAMAAACVMRHSLAGFGLTGSGLEVLIGFGAGLAPDLFLVTIARRAFQAIKIWGSRADPPEATRPSGLALLTIDDLTRDKIDRLSEIGIDTAHALARQNPFVLWTRLPFELGLIVDWMAQAQLYVLVRDSGLSALRALAVRNIFDLRCRLDLAAADAVAALGLHTEDAVALAAQIDTDPAYARLKEVRDALMPPKPPAQSPKTIAPTTSRPQATIETDRQPA